MIASTVNSLTFGQCSAGVIVEVGEFGLSIFFNLQLHGNVNVYLSDLSTLHSFDLGAFSLFDLKGSLEVYVSVSSITYCYSLL